MNANTFDRPHAVTDAEVAFPANAMQLMPAENEIPSEFKRINHPWVRWQAKWFFSGLDEMPKPKPGIDLKLAMRHLSVIQASLEPKHEHKQAAVAFLASKWFENEAANKGQA
jgi:hypothetical protein